MVNPNIQKLTQVLNTLDNISVKGFANITALCAAMQVLSDVIKDEQAANTQST